MDRQTWTMQASASNGPAARLFTALAATAMALAFVGSPVGAQESAEDAEEAQVTKEAYWTNPAPQAIPDILVEEFPPGVVCIVIPETCTDQARQVTGPIDDNRPRKDDAPKEPVQPVNPNSYPAARLGGTPRYISALQFTLPPIPEGQEVASFELLLTETQPTYAIDSPAFRQAVLATTVSIQEEEFASEEFAKILQEPDRFPPVDTEVIQVEACGTLEPFEEGDNQDWSEQPEVDCALYGATGERDEQGVWHFDLTFAAKAWAEGEIANNGVLIRPLAAENLAFGDPDTSDNAQLSLAGAESDSPPRFIIEFMPSADGGDTFGLAPGSGDGGGLGDGGGFDSSGGGDGGGSFASPPDFDSQMSDGGSDGFAEAEAPEVASSPEEGGFGGEDAGQQPSVAAERSGPVTPWYVWSLLPLTLAGLYVLSQALTAEPAYGVERRGAMTRLIEQRRAGSGASSPARA